MYPRKKVGVDPTWKYAELGPADLIKSLHLEHAAIDQEEVVRAEWMDALQLRPQLREHPSDK